ncbi:MAG: SDR family oxidoreductase [Ferruginibacter sp.]
MKLCHPYLKGDGSIVNLASSATKRWDMSGYGAYAAVKDAIRQLTRAAACEWGKDNIRTNVILPHASSPGLVVVDGKEPRGGRGILQDTADGPRR